MILRFAGSRVTLYTLPCLLVAGVLAALWWHSHGKPQKIALADGTVLLLRPGSTVQSAPGYPHPRSLHIDGEFLIEAAPAADVLEIRTRLLILTVVGHSKIHVIAHSSEPGEQVEVLFGDVTAHKNYPSKYNEPDHLGRGEMSMINQSIDLMEKEKVGPAEARSWGETFR